VPCSTAVLDRGVWLHISRRYLSCALVRARDIVFRHFYRSVAESAGKDFRDGAVVAMIFVRSSFVNYEMFWFLPCFFAFPLVTTTWTFNGMQLVCGVIEFALKPYVATFEVVRTIRKSRDSKGTGLHKIQLQTVSKAYKSVDTFIHEQICSCIISFALRKEFFFVTELKPTMGHCYSL
jgi:hypothetical protein